MPHERGDGKVSVAQFEFPLIPLSSAMRIIQQAEFLLWLIKLNWKRNASCTHADLVTSYINKQISLISSKKVSFWKNPLLFVLHSRQFLFSKESQEKKNLLISFQLDDAVHVQRNHRLRSPAMPRALAEPFRPVALWAVLVPFHNRKSFEVRLKCFHGHLLTEQNASWKFVLSAGSDANQTVKYRFGRKTKKSCYSNEDFVLDEIQMGIGWPSHPLSASRRLRRLISFSINSDLFSWPKKNKSSLRIELILIISADKSSKIRHVGVDADMVQSSESPCATPGKRINHQKKKCLNQYKSEAGKRLAHVSCSAGRANYLWSIWTPPPDFIEFN